MTALVDLTDYASIRAALGLSSKELSDTALATPFYILGVKADLRTIDSTLPATVDAAIAAPSSTTRTAFLEAVSLFTIYSTALRCFDTFTNLVPKSITDGKAGLIRHTDKLALGDKAQISERFAQASQELRSAVSVYQGSAALDTTQPTLMAVSSSDYDPITGV